MRMYRQKINHRIRIPGTKSGFTLAEVLITLTIIGVIAALTIPALLQNVQDAQYKTALRKTYSVLSQATNQIISDNGGTFVGITANDTDYVGLKNAYSAHLNYVKSCSDARVQGCWHPMNSSGGTWKKMDGTGTDSYTSEAGLILNDGTLLNIIALNQNCSASNSYTKPLICGWLIADVNGFKGPNITGKDIFYFFILKDRLEPFGSPNSSYHLCTGDGLFCAASELMQ